VAAHALTAWPECFRYHFWPCVPLFLAHPSRRAGLRPGFLAFASEWLIVKEHAFLRQLPE
jgi:hypothetical protein